MPHAQVYVPPHVARSQQFVAPRSLSDVACATQYWQVEVQCPHSTAFDKCPVNVAEQPQPGANCPEASAHQQVVLLFPHAADDTIADELVDWFQAEVCEQSNSCSDETPEVHLCLPAHISKQERAHWHKLAERHGLRSESQGVGSERQLYIKPRSAAKGSRNLSSQAKQVWDWCQMEGGHMWTYSQGEVQDMLRPGAQMPADVQQLIRRRNQAKELAEFLQNKDAAGAQKLLSSDKSLTWTRDDESGGYPLHIAVYHGLVDVVEWLVQTPNVTEQKDGRRDSPLMLARRCGHLDIIGLLLAAGAKDPASSRVTQSLNSSLDGPYSSWSRAARNRDARSHCPNLRSTTASQTRESRDAPKLSRADAADSWAGPPGFERHHQKQ